MFEITGELLKLLGLKGPESQRSGPQCDELTFWEELSFSEQCLSQVVSVAMKLRLLFLGRKAMTNLSSILESRDITLLTKVHVVKAMVFPAVLYGCESQAIKKAEHQRTDALELWCWRRLLRISWTSERPNQLILNEINPEYSFIGRTDAELKL